LKKRINFRTIEHLHGCFCPATHQCVKAVQELHSFAGDGANHLSAVARRTLSAHQSLYFQPVKQASDARSLIKHARGNFQGWKASQTCSAEDAEHVILRQRYTARVEKLGIEPPEITRSMQEVVHHGATPHVSRHNLLLLPAR
jgi:hypothetical protein